MALTLAVASVANSEACTTFAWEANGKKYMAKGLDYYMGQGVVLNNKRNVSKKAIVFGEQDRPMKWASKYGSVTFNQAGIEFPYGGMNEAGLTVEILWLSGTEHAHSAETPALNETQWIQYVLDTAANVDEAIEQAKKVRITQLIAPVHYMICDAGGKCGSLEYLNGNLEVHAGAEMPIKGLANSTYASLLESAEIDTNHLENINLDEALKRSGRAGTALGLATASSQSASNDQVQVGFSALDGIGSGSQWQIVYEITDKKIHFRTHQKRAIRSIDPTRMDYSCLTSSKMIDIEKELSGDVTDQMEWFSILDQKKLMTRFGNLPKLLVAAGAFYPSLFTRCEDLDNRHDR